MHGPVTFAGICGAVMVGVGAYASHGDLGEDARTWLLTGAQYGLWHNLALLATVAIGGRAPGRLLTLSGLAFASGILLFSGSLFLRALMGWDGISTLTPVGGIAFIAGWLLLAAHGVAMRRKLAS